MAQLELKTGLSNFHSGISFALAGRQIKLRENICLWRFKKSPARTAPLNAKRLQSTKGEV